MGIKVITILFKNEEEIQGLYKNLLDSLESFTLLITMNSMPINRIKAENVVYIGDCNNVGFGTAINRTLELIKDEDMLFFMNSDVRIKSINFNRLHDLVSSNYLIGPSCVSENLIIQDTFRRDITLFGIMWRIFKRVFMANKGSLGFEYLLKEQINVDWIIGGCFVIKGRGFLKLNGFDERYFMYLEDQDLCLRARDMGMEILYTNAMVCQYEADRKSLNLKNLFLIKQHIKSLITFILLHPKVFFTLK